MCTDPVGSAHYPAFLNIIHFNIIIPSIVI
jgi:hypothetical protein